MKLKSNTTPSKLDSILEAFKKSVLYPYQDGSKSIGRIDLRETRSQPRTKQAIIEAMLELVKETKDDPEIYWGEGQKIIEQRIKNL